MLDMWMAARRDMALKVSALLHGHGNNTLPLCVSELSHRPPVSSAALMRNMSMWALHRARMPRLHMAGPINDPARRCPLANTVARLQLQQPWSRALLI